MISKKLLCEVLGLNKKITMIVSHIGNELIWDGDYNCNGRGNTHELAHKVKEWAYNRGEFLSSGYDVHGGWCLNRARNISFVSMDIPLTEPEAIFKAGQWILENKDKQ